MILSRNPSVDEHVWSTQGMDVSLEGLERSPSISQPEPQERESAPSIHGSSSTSVSSADRHEEYFAVDAEPRKPWVLMSHIQILSSGTCPDLIPHMQELLRFDQDPAEAKQREPYDPERLSKEELQSLEFSHGAHILPNVAFRLELCLSYIRHVPRHLQVMDPEKLLWTVLLHSGHEKPDLLLVQVVMFAGSVFIDAECLQAAGYRSRQSAQKGFLQRVCSLYESGYEGNAASAAIHSLLLVVHSMSHQLGGGQREERPSATPLDASPRSAADCAAMAFNSFDSMISSLVVESAICLSEGQMLPAADHLTAPSPYSDREGMLHHSNSPDLED